MSANPLWRSPQEFGEQVVFTLQQVGQPLDQPEDFNFYLSFPTAAQARACASQLREAGFEVEDELPTPGDEWLCVARKRVAPTPAIFAEVGGLCMGVAAELEGEFDGWEPVLPPLTLPGATQGDPGGPPGGEDLTAA